MKYCMGMKNPEKKLSTPKTNRTTGQCPLGHRHTYSGNIQRIQEPVRMGCFLFIPNVCYHKYYGKAL